MVLKLRKEAPSWLDAKCLGDPPTPENDVWFDNSEDGYEDQTAEGLDFCNGTVDDKVCPMREGCLLFALVNNERLGVWGGTSEADRRAIRKMWPWKGGNVPRPEWKWYPAGEVAALLPAKERASLDSDVDE